MTIKASRNDVWMAVIDDWAGGAAGKLEALARAGTDLEVVFARRTPEHPGQASSSPDRSKARKVTRAVQEAGFKKSETIYGIRFEGSDKPGPARRSPARWPTSASAASKRARSAGIFCLSWRSIPPSTRPKP